MNSKKYLFNEAERLFTYEFRTVDDIASRLNINRKTVMKWKDDGDWEKKRKDFLKSKQSFHAKCINRNEEIYEIGMNYITPIEN